MPQMNAVIFEGKEEMRVVRLPSPACGPREVLLRVAACGICGGDARSYFVGDKFTGKSRIPGHEAVGIVAEVGNAAGGWKLGERLALAADVRCGHCHFCKQGVLNMCESLKTLGKHMGGAMADYFLLTEEILALGVVNRVPEKLKTVHAALSEPLCSVLASHDELGIQPGETVVVLGCGPMGVLHLELLRRRGARVIPADTSPERAERARRDFGAELAFDAGRPDFALRVRELTGGLGAHAAITAAPSGGAIVQALQLVRKRGRIGVFGGLPAGQAEVTLDMNRVHYDELRILGNFSYHPRYHARALELLAEGAVSCDKLITTYKLEDTRQGLLDMKSGKALKAVVLPNDGELA